MKRLKQTLTRNILNIPGWRTNRKIVVIESDDWGSIRMPSKEVYNRLLKRGIRVDKCHYCSNDSLETEKDLRALFEVLDSVKDGRGNSAIITANTVVTNPDFDKIKESNFNEYHYKLITESYKEFEDSENSFKLIMEANQEGLFSLQSHGREHLNIKRWMHYLRNDFSETKLAFDKGVYGISTSISSEKRKSFLPAFDFETYEEEQEANIIVKDGLIILKPRATYLKSGINFKIKVIETKEEFLFETTKIINKKNTLLCQEFIPGGYNSSIYYLFYRSKNGVVLDNMGARIFQTSPEGGIMAMGQTKFIKNISEISKTFLDTINYNGFGGLEFKMHNNRCYFIEMNIRVEAILKIAEISNSPLSLLSYYDLSNNVERRDALINSKQNDGMVYMDFIPTLVTKIKSRKYISFIRDVFNAIFSPKTKLNIFSMSDPKPFFFTLKNLIVR